MIGPRRQSGFTLLEVVVALGILAIALVAAVKGISTHVNNMAYLKERTLAHWVAMNKVTEFQLSGEFPGAGERSGAVEMASREWHWVVKISTTEDSEVRRLDVTVTPEANRNQTLATLIGYLGKP